MSTSSRSQHQNLGFSRLLRLLGKLPLYFLSGVGLALLLARLRQKLEEGV